jgi:hypothetical protein
MRHDFLPKIVQMYIKTSFFNVLSEVKKDFQDVATRKVFCKIVHKKVFPHFDIKVVEVNFDLARCD